MRRVSIWCGGLVVLAAIIAWAALRGATDHPNLILITLDTTRADRIGAYGWKSARTPELDRLAAGGVRFDSAFTVAPLTLPAHVAIMTGLQPFYSGVRDNCFRLPETATTLAERLRANGYATGAAVAAFVLDAQFGLDQGFDTYDDQMPQREFERFQIPERSAAHVVDTALAWLQGCDRQRPFFLWAHFYDPHHPYRTPDSFPALVSNPYELEIAYCDAQLKRLLDTLDASPPNSRNTVIIVAGDHGEALGQHGEETHGYFVYDSTLRVPLIIHAPGGAAAGTQIDTPVSVVDLMPTALELLGFAPPRADEIHGRSLVALINHEPQSREMFTRRALYFECFSPLYHFGWAPVRGVRLGERKFIDSPIPELYTLNQNAREGVLHNVIDRESGTAVALRAELTKLLASELKQPALSSPEVTIDAEGARKLMALGYLAGRERAEREWGPEDDLKSQLPLYNMILSAGEQIGAGQWESGQSLLLRALERDPQNPRALALLSEVVTIQPELAAEGLLRLEQLTAAASLAPEALLATLIACGRARLGLGEGASSVALFLRAVALRPDDAIAWGWLATARLHQGQTAEALEAAKRAVRQAPGADALHVQLGLVHFLAGEIAEGAAAWQGLLSRAESPITIWEIADRIGNDAMVAEESIVPLRAIVGRVDLPTSVNAAVHATLSRAHSNAGRPADALAALEAAVSDNSARDATAYCRKARLLRGLLADDQAHEVLLAAQSLDPDNIEIVTDLSTLLGDLGAGAEAILLLSGYHANHLDDPTAANNLAWALAEYGQPEQLDRALQLAKSASSQVGGSAAFAHTLGWVHYRRRELAAAIFSLERAVRLNRDIAVFHYHLGLALELDGARDKAHAAYGQALKLLATQPARWAEDCRRRAAAD